MHLLANLSRTAFSTLPSHLWLHIAPVHLWLQPPHPEAHTITVEQLIARYAQVGRPSAACLLGQVQQ
jgi:hypothetical protein